MSHDRCILPPLPRPHWAKLPVCFEVSFTLTPGSCVYRQLYEEYEVADLAEAARRVIASDGQGIFPRYRIYVPGLQLPFAWDAVWPLRRRGSLDEVQRRATVETGDWQKAPDDDTLLEIFTLPKGVWGFHSRLMLRVGGCTPEEAADNWLTFARSLRQLLPGRSPAPKASH